MLKDFEAQIREKDQHFKKLEADYRKAIEDLRSRDNLIAKMKTELEKGSEPKSGGIFGFFRKNRSRSPVGNQ